MLLDTSLTAGQPRNATAAVPVRHAQQGTYRADIDGLRAIAVLLVVAFHAFPTVVQGGFIGVDLFFVISGFLISTIISEQLDAGSFSFAQFYVRRIRRIFPALLLVMASCLAFGWFALLASEYAQLGKHLAAGAGFVSNFVSWRESGYFDNAADTKPLLHLWSLAIEEQFYLLWPALLWLAFRYRLQRLTLCVLLVLLSFALNVGLVHSNPVATFYSPATRCWELLAGSMLASFASARGRNAGAATVWQQGCSLLGVMLLATGLLLINRERAFPGGWALLPVTGAVLILAAGPAAWFNRVVLAQPVLVGLGLISYPLYLWHWPMLVFAHLAQYNATPPWPTRAAAVALSIVLAALTYRWVERPLRFGPRVRASVIGLCLAMGVLALAGLAIHWRAGLPWRTADAKVALFGDILSPVETRLPNDSCQRLLGRPAVPGAVCLTRSAQPEMLILGDSHAMALNSAAYMGQSPLRTVLLAGHGCLPFLSYQNYGPQDNRDAKKCFTVTREGLALAQQTASLKTVVLVSRGPLYFSGKGFGMEESDPRFSGWTIEAVPGTAAAAEPALSNQQAFVRAYVETASQFLALGKRVVFVIDVPEFPILPEYCIANRPVAFRNQDLPTCVLDRAVVDQRQKEYRQLVAQMAAQLPGLQFYDTLPAFCSGTSCASKDAKHVYFYDNNHVNLSGSARLMEGLAAQLAR